MTATPAPPLTTRERIDAMCETWRVSAQDGSGAPACLEVRAISLAEAHHLAAGILERAGMRRVRFLSIVQLPPKPK